MQIQFRLTFLTQVLDAYEASCGRFDDYSLKYARVLTNLCHYVTLQGRVAEPAAFLAATLRAQPGCR
jgi:hypothetical protein